MRICHIAHIIMAYCSSGGDFIGANDGEKSCVASQPTNNAIVMAISQVETSPHFHEDKFYSSCFSCCGGLCRYQRTRSPCRFPLNPSEPPPKVARRSNEIILQTCFGQAVVAGVAKTITADQLTLSALPPNKSIGGNLNASVSIFLRRACNKV